MTFRKSLVALACGALTLASVRQASAADDITIGVAAAYSGWFEAYDGEAAKMAALWIERANGKGGLLGKQIKVISGDTKSDRVEGAKVGQELVNKGANLLLVSADYDYGAPAALQAQKAKIISVFLGASDPKAGILGVGPFSFTANNAAQLEGAIMADWGYRKKGLRNGYMLIDESIEYTKSVCAGYDWQFAANNGKVVGRDTFKGLEPTISSQITRLSERIRSEGVDHVMVCSVNPAGASSVRQLRAAGINLPIFGATGMDGIYWVNSVPGLKDFYLPSQALTANDPRPAVNEVSAAFEKKYGKPPTTQYAYPIYVFLDMWSKAVTEAKSTDAAAVVEVLNRMKDEATILGPRTFTPKLHVQINMPMTVMSYADGKETAVEEWQIKDTIPDAVLYRIKTN